ncbi:MAG: pyridoxamine 5'-phosphate oxidase family protein, partial [Bacteroidota bacterium]
TPSTPLPQPVLEAEAGFEIGLLFLELSTRRRFRASGTVIRQQDRLHIRLAEAYPNCPKYIQRRLPKSVDHIVGAAKDWESGLALSPAGKSIIEQADTFFVGSVSAAGRMDASHRGGPVGFVEITPGGVLKVPDYQGNGLFNTLGNIVEDPRAGLLFIDFETGALLQLSGEASLLFNQESDEDVIKTTGTGRYWTFKISGWRMLRSQTSLQMEYIDASPFNPQLA